MSLFESATELTPEWLRFIKSTPLIAPRIDFNDGQSYQVDARTANGVDIIKYEDIFIAPTAKVNFGPKNPAATGFPRAFFIVCKTLVFRPLQSAPTLKFEYCREQAAAPPTPPQPIANGGNVGTDGTRGIDGYPQADLAPRTGPPIYFVFNQVRFEVAQPDLQLAVLSAQGTNGQPGGEGSAGGGCTGGACKDHPGNGGAGGNGGYGIGGGVIFLYAPAAPLERFYDRLGLNYKAGLGAQGGQGGWSSGTDGGFGGIPEFFRAPSGSAGLNGVDGTVYKHVKNDVLSLFP